MPTAAEVIEIMTKYDWTAEQWPNGLWVIGPENEDGLINALGIDVDFMEALRKAKEVVL